MQVRCKYCGSFISDVEEKCPNCGATNELLNRVGAGVPKTIDELKTWYQDHNLPPEETTRFFIGKNIKEARAFGIYQEGDKFVVYKNKSDGSRAIRYQGKDESYAVNELYLRLKEEIQNQKAHNNHNNNQNLYATSTFLKDIGSAFLKFIVISLILLLTVTILAFITDHIHENSPVSPYGGYYNIDNQYYYYYDSIGWFKVTDTENNTWQIAPDFKPKLKRKEIRNISWSNTPEDSIPDSIDFTTSGYYFDMCNEGYFIDKDSIYFMYDNDWYKYIDDNYKWFEVNYIDKFKSYEIVLPFDYPLVDDIDKNIRLSCDQPIEYNPEWGIIDFRQTSDYKPAPGYYIVDGVYYYYFNNAWYYYDNDYNGWKTATKPNDTYYDYYSSEYYSSSYDVDNFNDSSYYRDYERSRESSSYDHDWDSGSSWDSSDSWDSGSTDWDSDW